MLLVLPGQIRAAVQPAEGRVSGVGSRTYRKLHLAQASSHYFGSMQYAYARTSQHTGQKHRPVRVQRKAQCQALEEVTDKIVWVETDSDDTFISCIEGGVGTFLFPPGRHHLANIWASLGKFKAVMRNREGMLTDVEKKQQLGRVVPVTSQQDIASAGAFANQPGFVMMDAEEWQVIPAENLVASYQGKPATLLGVARTAAEARVLLEALETGTDGVILRTNNPLEVRELLKYVRARTANATQRLPYDYARVTQVIPVGMGDRVAVDMCSLFKPGEGLLVGSFSRAFFLVHSECSESKYINSRPFRVNAGPVHAYIAMPGGKTAYLSELKTGAEVLIVDAYGKQRTAIVGRVKVETRPLVLVEVECADGSRHSSMLQNAETVRLVGPAPPKMGGSPPRRDPDQASEVAESVQHSRLSNASAMTQDTRAGDSMDAQMLNNYLGGSLSLEDTANLSANLPTMSARSSVESAATGKTTQRSVSLAASAKAVAAAEPAWRAVSVAQLSEGDIVLLHREEGARHTGVKIDENIVEH